MVYFDQSNFEGILKKLREFSAQLSTSQVCGCVPPLLCPDVTLLTKPNIHQDASKAWSQDGKEAVAVECLIKTLKETSRYHASSFNDQELRVVRKMLTWPSPLRFPGTSPFLFGNHPKYLIKLPGAVLDLVRSMALHPVGAAYFSRPEAWQELETVLLDSLWDNTVVPNTMLALRVLANLFNTKVNNKLSNMMIKVTPTLPTRALEMLFYNMRKPFSKLQPMPLVRATRIFASLSPLFSSSTAPLQKKPQKLGKLSQLLSSFSVQLQDMGSGFEGKMQVISILAEMLGPESEDEVMYSALVALGTLASNDPAIQGLAKDLEIPSNLRRCNDGGKHTSKTRAATAEILQLLG